VGGDIFSGVFLLWVVNLIICNGGFVVGINLLMIDNDFIYVIGFVFGVGGNFEGIVCINNDGIVNWVEDCFCLMDRRWWLVVSL